MSERLADIESRIGTVRQLAAVITAMRGIAAARLREAQAHLDSIRAYAGTVGNGIAGVLQLLPDDLGVAGRNQPPRRQLLVAFCTEQGFVGLFNEHVLAAASVRLQGSPGTELLVVGDRGAALATEQGLAVSWSTPMIAHSAQLAPLANDVLDAIYHRLHNGDAQAVTVLHARPTDGARADIVARQLVPFDYRRFPAARQAAPPRLNLPAPGLLEKLAEEYVFAEVCEALMLSFAAENDARMRAMMAARSNVQDTLAELSALARQMRQEEITSEVLELARFERRKPGDHRRQAPGGG